MPSRYPARPPYKCRRTMAVGSALQTQRGLKQLLPKGNTCLFCPFYRGKPTKTIPPATVLNSCRRYCYFLCRGRFFKMQCQLGPVAFAALGQKPSTAATAGAPTASVHQFAKAKLPKPVVRAKISRASAAAAVTKICCLRLRFCSIQSTAAAAETSTSSRLSKTNGLCCQAAMPPALVAAAKPLTACVTISVMACLVFASVIYRKE